ncbi:hypothetical protein AAC387_Pa11g0333 [Persea americana]
MFLSRSIPFLLHFWVGFLILCIGTLKFNSCVGDKTTSTSGCLERERQALIYFKQGLKDPSNRLSSWVGDDCCRWAGIHCSNKTGHVVQLTLRGPFKFQFSSPIATYSNREAAFNRSCISDLSSNRLKGSIPLSICQMKDLVYLSFSNNQLTHEIPQCLWDLQNLETLDLENNFLSGGIPSSKSNLSQLTSLHLSKNKLSGELPPSMKSCTGLITLDLRENNFSGRIPKWIGEHLTSLMFLLLRTNMFQGNIPPQLSLLSELQVLDLSQNNLSGKIPEFFGNFSAMAIANKTNQVIYSGPQFGHLESIWVLWKGSQHEYSSTISLVMNINLSENDLDGEIPEGITKLFGLQSLNLSKNHLIGTIPENISDMRWLESLDLSWNRLSGTIPHTLSYMTSLNHLNLSFNNFSGRIPSSRQLDTINDSSIYMGNPLLCGPPLLNQCPRDEIFPDSQPLSDGDKEAKDELEIQLFYISMGPGFVVGFWVVCGILLFKRSWRVAYYMFFDDMGDRLYVAVASKLAKFKRNKGLQDIKWAKWVTAKANSASGMAIDDECKLKFFELKSKRNFRYIVLKIEELLRLYPGRVPYLELMFDCFDRPVVRSRDYRGRNSSGPPPLLRYCGDKDTLGIVFPDWSFWGR